MKTIIKKSKREQEKKFCVKLNDSRHTTILTNSEGLVKRLILKYPNVQVTEPIYIN
jgi:transcriptional regulator of NAD metabolism